MSCPTCDHTMQQVGIGIRMVRFWCPRCGTLVLYDTIEKITRYAVVPKLVERCREFGKTFPPGDPPLVSYSQEWKRLGIEETINTPKDRPQ